MAKRVTNFQVKVVADSKQLTREFDSTKAKAKQVKKEIEKPVSLGGRQPISKPTNLKSLTEKIPDGKAIGGFAKGLAGGSTAGIQSLLIGGGATAAIAGLVALGKSIYNFVSGINEQVKEIQQLARQLRSSFRTTLELRQFANVAGASFSDISSSISNLNTVIGQTNLNDPTLLSTFEQLGLSVDQLNNETATQRLQTIFDALNQINDPAQRFALGLRIFGSSFQELDAAFQGTNLQDAIEDVNEFQAQIDPEQLARFNREQARLNFAWEQLWVQIGSDLIPITTSFITWMIRLGRVFRGLQRQQENYIRGIIAAFQSLANADVAGAIANLNGANNNAANILQNINSPVTLNPQPDVNPNNVPVGTANLINDIQDSISNVNREARNFNLDSMQAQIADLRIQANDRPVLEGLIKELERSQQVVRNLELNYRNLTNYQRFLITDLPRLQSAVRGLGRESQIGYAREIVSRFRQFESELGLDRISSFFEEGSQQTANAILASQRERQREDRDPQELILRVQEAQLRIEEQMLRNDERLITAVQAIPQLQAGE